MRLEGCMVRGDGGHGGGGACMEQDAVARCHDSAWATYGKATVHSVVIAAVSRLVGGEKRCGSLEEEEKAM